MSKCARRVIRSIPENKRSSIRPGVSRNSVSATVRRARPRRRRSTSPRSTAKRQPRLPFSFHIRRLRPPSAVPAAFSIAQSPASRHPLAMLAPRPYVSEPMDPVATSPSAQYRAFKATGLLFLAAAWIVLGLVGHDPWKFDDATNFGVALDIADHGDFVAPSLGGEPFLDRPPLMPALGAIAIRALSPPLEPYNAARLAAGVLLALMLVFATLASREFSGGAFRWLPMLVLIGTLGFWDRAHALSGQLGTTAAVAS